MGVPMLRVKSRAAFIDDSADFLDGLIFSMPREICATYHLSPRTLDPILRASEVYLRKEAATFLSITRAQEEGNAVQLALQYFADPARFSLTSVLVADYSMPAEDGISLCKRHSYRGLQRVLLTGIADNDRAIEAFNLRAIERFLPKQAFDLRRTVEEVVPKEQDRSAATRGEYLALGLEPQLMELLDGADVQASLSVLLDSLDVVEYMLLGTPQGLLCVKRDGALVWVQLEHDGSLRGHDEALSLGVWDSAASAGLKSRKLFANVHFASQMGLPPEAAPVAALSRKPFVGAAVFAVNGTTRGPQPAVYATWAAANAVRTIEQG